MNFFFSLEKASSFSPAPAPPTVVLEPAVKDEAVVGTGAAASASLRLSLMVVMLGGQTDAGKRRERERKVMERVGCCFSFYCSVADLCQRHRRRRRPAQMTKLTQGLRAAAASD